MYTNGYTPLEQYINYGVDQAGHVVEGIEWLKQRMDDFAHVQMEMQASIHSHTSISITSGLTLMIKSCKDLSLGEVSGALVWVVTCLISFPAFPVISSLVLPVGRITTVVMLLVSIASIS
jgi:hypothetical protein